jgi:hypothetical protein
MGKFFLVGLFVGAAVTWAVMNYLVTGNLLEKPEVQEAIQAAKADSRLEAQQEADKEWQKKLKDKVDALEKEHKERTAGLTEQVGTLTEQNKRLKDDAESAKEDVALARNKIEEQREHIRDLEKDEIGATTASKDLLVKRSKLRPVRIMVDRELATGCTVVGQALLGWPDVQLIKNVAEGITGLAAQHRTLAQDVRLYVENHSRGLKKELGNLGPYRAGVQEQDISAVDVLAAKIVSAVSTMKTDSCTVEARAVETQTEGWTDSEVFVKPGDIIQVRAEGSWRMALNLPSAGPEGWDEGAQHKLYREARAGGLILQIGISDRVHPAYLGKAIVAEAEGRVKLRMNDKSVRDNHGSVKVEVVSSNPKTLRQVMELWEAYKKLKP